MSCEITFVDTFSDGTDRRILAEHGLAQREREIEQRRRRSEVLAEVGVKMRLSARLDNSIRSRALPKRSPDLGVVDARVDDIPNVHPPETTRRRRSRSRIRPTLRQLPAH